MFVARNFKARTGSILSQDDLRTVELATAFRRIHCYKCDLTSIYKYRVQQIRRAAPQAPAEGEGLTEYQQEAIKAIPRFAEIPETVKCKRCGEVLGIYPECIY